MKSHKVKSWDDLSDIIKDPNILIDKMTKRTQDAPMVNAEPVRHGELLNRWNGMFQLDTFRV